MSRKVSKRKRPDRDVHMVSEEALRTGGIFNDRTMRCLSKFYNKGVIQKVDFSISRGKEADVYLAEVGASDIVSSGNGFVALKFFRGEGISFNKMREYIDGDPRFGNLRGGKLSIVEIWCRKEFGNLVLAREAGAFAPRPYMFKENILAMEFIGDENGVPSRKLKDVVLNEPEKAFKNLIGQVGKLRKVGLIHSDLSEFNVLVQGEAQKLVLIDMGQSVVIRHPMAAEFLERDVHNVCRFFKSKYRIESNEAEILKSLGLKPIEA